MRGFPVSGPALTPPCSLGTAAPPAQSCCLLRGNGRDQPLAAAWSWAKPRGTPAATPPALSTAAPARGPHQRRPPGPRSPCCSSSWAQTCLTRRPRAPSPREPRRPPRRLRDRRGRPQQSPEPPSPLHSRREPPRHPRPLRGPLGHLLSLQRAPSRPRGPGQQPGGPPRSWLKPQHFPRRTPAPRRPPRSPSSLANPLLVPPPGSQQPLRPAPGSPRGRRQRRRKPSCEPGPRLGDCGQRTLCRQPRGRAGRLRAGPSGHCLRLALAGSWRGRTPPLLGGSCSRRRGPSAAVESLRCALQDRPWTPRPPVPCAEEEAQKGPDQRCFLRPPAHSLLTCGEGESSLQTTGSEGAPPPPPLAPCWQRILHHARAGLGGVSCEPPVASDIGRPQK